MTWEVILTDGATRVAVAVPRKPGRGVLVWRDAQGTVRVEEHELTTTESMRKGKLQ